MIEILLLLGLFGIIVGGVAYAFFVAADVDDNNDDDDWRHA